MFMEICRSTGLSPFLKEIYYAPQIGVMASRDGYLRKANESPEFDGMETRVERNDKDIPIKAVCTVWRKDRGHPVIAEAYYNEYKKTTDVWQKYPSAMIAKVAEVLALKRSFAINGCVTEEEVGTAEERGSKEAQREYLASKGIGIDAGPPMPVERSMPTQGSSPVADAVKSPSTTKAKKGAISFDALKKWGDLKKEVRSVMGNEELYYSALSAYSYKHSNEIANEDDARAIWKLIGAGLNKAKQDADLLTTLQEAGTVLGVETFDKICTKHAIGGIDEIMAMDSEPLAALLSELKTAADERRTKS
jgi:hypothetical protein